MPIAEVLLRKDLGTKPYRLTCRFRVPAAPPRWHYLWTKWKQDLERAKFLAAERFVTDMKAHGFLYMEQFPVKMRGPFVAIDPMNLRKPPPRLTARQMVPGVLAGNRFRDQDSTQAVPMPLLDQTEEWEFELAMVFMHQTILVEYPTEAEQQEDFRKR